MNAARRKQIAAVLVQIEEMRNLYDAIKSEVETIRDDEQEYHDNMPESLQGGEKSEKSQSAIDALESVCEAFDGLEIDGVVSSLEEAAN